MTGMAVLITVLLALLAAAVVALLALTQAPKGERGRPVHSFRRGLRAWLRPDEEQAAAARAAAAVEPVDVSLDQMLRANVEFGEGYLQPDEISATLHDATSRVLPHRGR